MEGLTGNKLKEHQLTSPHRRKRKRQKTKLVSKGLLVHKLKEHQLTSPYRRKRQNWLWRV